jgi:hypothetical protein
MGEMRKAFWHRFTGADKVMYRKRRLIVSGIILTVFYGALLFEYWPDLVPLLLRVTASARAAGAETIETRYFDVLNNSNASVAQIQVVVNALEVQYEAIVAYLEVPPPGKIQVLFVNGSGPALMDGTQLIINYENGLMDIEFTPLFLVWLIEEIPMAQESGFGCSGGYAIQVVEAAGLGESLIRQPLDDWAVLLQDNEAALPLEEAWRAPLPSDEDSAYNLMRSVLLSGSFMGWVREMYGLDTARHFCTGVAAEDLTGRTLAENEIEWLAALNHKAVEPESCEEVIPTDSIFYIMCGKLQPGVE